MEPPNRFHPLQSLCTKAFQRKKVECGTFLVFPYFCNYSAKNSCSQLLISCTRLLLSCTLLRISYIRPSNQSNTELYQAYFSSLFFVLCKIIGNIFKEGELDEEKVCRNSDIPLNMVLLKVFFKPKK